MLLKKHGGVREEAYTEDINLAFLLEDGMKIHIPTKQEKEEEKKLITKESGVSVNEQSKVVEEENTKNNANGKININKATQTQLETLPGIGPSTSSKILSYRKEVGKFKSIDEIKEVSGIGEAKFNKIKDLIEI